MTDPYASGVLLEEHHHRLVANLDGFAKDAGIQSHWIFTKLPDDIEGAELEYLIRFKKHETEGQLAGLCYVGKGKGIEMRMAAVAGLLVRNFIRARVMTLGALIDAAAARNMPDLTCILIPNFFVSGSSAGMIAKWQLAALYDILIDRQLRGRQTILFVKDMEALGTEYGLSFKTLVDDHYLKVSV